MLLLSRRLPGLIYSHRYKVYCASLLIGTIIYLLFKWNLLCTNLQAWQHVNKMCRLYDKGLAIGSLCEPLCTTKEINSLTCHSFRATKEAVFSAEWHKTRLVFKSASADVPVIHWYDNGVIKYPTEKEFQSTIRAVVKSKLNLTLAHDTIIRLSRLRPFYEENDSVKRQREMDNLWILLQDNEYLLSSIHTDKDVFPQVYGTCGPYFAVEYIEPIQDIYSLLYDNESKENWGKRLKIAVQILELLDELDTAFQEPYHLCDIKIQHFGIVNSEVKLKFNDLYNVYPHSILNKLIGDIDRNFCKNDDDCDLLDCRSKCDIKLMKCHPFVVNNNLQIVCEKIFLGWHLSNTVIVPGLLITQHTPSDLASLLRQCAHPQFEIGKARSKPDDELKKRLYNIITEMEQTINNDLNL